MLKSLISILVTLIQVAGVVLSLGSVTLNDVNAQLVESSSTYKQLDLNARTRVLRSLASGVYHNPSQNCSVTVERNSVLTWTWSRYETIRFSIASGYGTNPERPQSFGRLEESDVIQMEEIAEDLLNSEYSNFEVRYKTEIHNNYNFVRGRFWIVEKDVWGEFSMGYVDNLCLGLCKNRQVSCSVQLLRDLETTE